MKSGGRKAIYFDGKVKGCSGPCKEKKPLQDFEPSGNAQGPLQAGYYRSMCRKCHSEYTNQKAKEKRFKTNPDGYWICECKSIVSVKRKKCYACQQYKM